MVTKLFLVFVVFSALVAIKNWRLGLALLIVVGVLQDPVRKMMPGAPAFMVLAFFPVWIGMMTGIVFSGQWPWRQFGSLHPQIKSRIQLFIAALILATVVVFQYGFIAWKVAAIGLFSYLLPLLTLMLAFAYARNPGDVSKIIVFYCLFTAVILIGGLFEVMHIYPGWQALGTSALGMHWIKYVSYGHTLDLIAGFYRSPDIMGWHAACLSMFALTLALYGRAGPRWFWLLLALWGVFGVFISGRNKMIGMTAVWIIVVSLMHIYIGKAGRVVMLSLAVGVLAFSVLLLSGKLGLSDDYALYATHVHERVFQQAEAHSSGSLSVTYRQSGFFGKGIGTASQGIQHLGLPFKRSWQEGGLPKLLVELGVLGLIAIFLLAWATYTAFLNTIKYSRKIGRLSTLQIGLTGFVAANIANFIISFQVFSDGLIMVILALAMGMMLSSPYWVQEKQT